MTMNTRPVYPKKYWGPNQEAVRPEIERQTDAWLNLDPDEKVAFIRRNSKLYKKES